MNPYEEPTADLYQPAATGAGIAWVRIGVAVVAYWLAYVGVKSLATWNFDQWLTYYTMLGYSLIAGPMTGAIFVAVGAQQRWLLHAVLYTLLLVVSYTIAIYAIHGPIPLPALSGIVIAWLIVGFPTIVVSMSLARVAMRVSRNSRPHQAT